MNLILYDETDDFVSDFITLSKYTLPTGKGYLEISEIKQFFGKLNASGSWSKCSII